MTAKPQELHLNVVVPAAQARRVLAAFAGSHGYSPKVRDPDLPFDDEGVEVWVDNPEGEPEFARRMLRQYVAGLVQGWEARTAEVEPADDLGLS